MNQMNNKKWIQMYTVNVTTRTGFRFRNRLEFASPFQDRVVK
jgi:hypothetical protein